MTAAKKLNQNNNQYVSMVDEKWRTSMLWDKVIVSGQNSPQAVLSLYLESGFAHVLQPESLFFSKEINSTALMLDNNKALVETPLATIMNPTNCTLRSEATLKLFDFELSKAKQKVQVLLGIEDILKRKSASTSIRTDILVIADELSTNAVYNAPFMDLENNHVGAPRRDQDVKMDAGKFAHIFLGADDKCLVIGCSDPYGTLNLEKLLKRIKNCYDTSVADNINMSGVGGAGIGSYMVFNSTASYYAAVGIGQYTTICCVLPLKMNSRERSSLSKNLHLSIEK